MRAPLAIIVGAGLLLAGCGLQATPQASTVPETYRDQTGAAWSYHAPQGQVRALALGGDASSWSAVLSASSSWGPIEINSSNGEKAAGDGHPLTMKGVVYPYGLGLHANAEIKYSSSQASGLECAFSATVGIDDEVGANGEWSSVVFQAYADGVKVYDSGVIRGTDAAPKQVAFTFPNARELSVVVNDNGDMNYFDHTDIANPLVSCKPAVTAPSLTLDQQALDIYHLHTNTLQATFSNFPAGQVQLRLEGDGPLGTFPPGLIRPSLPFALQTKSVNLGTGAHIPGTQIPAVQTLPVTIGAPQNLGIFSSSGPSEENFRLIASVGGQDVAQASVLLRQLRIEFTARFEPATLTGRPGEQQTAVLIVTASPPLSGPLPLRPVLNNNIDAQFRAFTVNSVDPTTGDGGTMRAVVHFALPSLRNQTPVPVSETTNFGMGIAVGDVTTGYRDFYYGSRPDTSISVTVSP